MATENFTAADGTLVRNLSGWAAVVSDLSVTGNRAFADNGSGGASCARNTEVLSADQYAECLFPVVGSRFVGPSVRCASGADTYYAYIGSGNYQEVRFVRHVGGTEAIPHTGTYLTGTTTVLRLEVSGTSLTFLKNGVADSSLNGGSSVTDTNIASGFAGLAGNGTLNTSSTCVDDWSSGSLGGGGGSTRGMPFALESTAFNGGRTFAGILR